GLCIGGTHGKTTTSTLFAYLLHCSSVGCNAFLGGSSMNFGTNLLLDAHSPYNVIEADEYDRSFLHLTPEMAAITAMDEDHLDIYGSRKNLIDAFEAFAAKVKEGGKLFVKKGLELKKTEVSGYYAVGEPAGYYSDNLRVEGVCSVFDYRGERAEIKDLRLGVPGRMNVENATLAITLALEAGVTPEEIKEALPGFKGVLRRFNIHASGRTIYIDDYAHHPREIEAVLLAIREIWPDRKLTVAFQPHLYSRTSDFHDWFARSLNIADEVILLDIYPAREQPLPGVTSGIIRKDVVKPSAIVPKERFLKFVEEKVRGGVFVTLGAGDIDRFVPALTSVFKKGAN
ncbi:MAG: UDP-N-acetylmuramate--L-alanine ligase, partial [Odoribacter sp.]|nr:UDP-N-acetylmuramate--L-alanine ligase [Odoribacter sp.]